MNNSKNIGWVGTSMILIFLVFVSFHVLVLAGIFPYKIVWGGRLANNRQMQVFECASVIINLFMLVIVAIKTRLLKWQINTAFINGFLWFMFGLFLLNTIGNLLSQNKWEKIIFTPITFILALLSLRLATVKEHH